MSIQYLFSPAAKVLGSAVQTSNLSVDDLEAELARDDKELTKGIGADSVNAVKIATAFPRNQSLDASSRLFITSGKDWGEAMISATVMSCNGRALKNLLGTVFCELP